jgi:hypothetical protein
VGLHSPLPLPVSLPLPVPEVGVEPSVPLVAVAPAVVVADPESVEEPPVEPLPEQVSDLWLAHQAQAPAHSVLNNSGSIMQKF